MDPGAAQKAEVKKEEGAEEAPVDMAEYEPLVEFTFCHENLRKLVIASDFMEEAGYVE